MKNDPLDEVRAAASAVAGDHREYLTAVEADAHARVNLLRALATLTLDALPALLSPIAPGGPRVLEVDPGNTQHERLLLTSAATFVTPTVVAGEHKLRPVSYEEAAAGWSVQTILTAILAALNRQLLGRKDLRTMEIEHRTEYLRAISVLVAALPPIDPPKLRSTR